MMAKLTIVISLAIPTLLWFRETFENGVVWLIG